ncbi:ShlB/FhaC/HecB family hemolysin secretion/activation protein [Hoeflea marina]|uniref:ShlB/FhaC/HecB family hemolysin secretion/activation protein n=1 Tax=Hoeflea marina TaxID=274592 RepID=UPI001FDF5385|nr:ShlB/FhaC/HecB family hemolysin secretion/activation protein [Hoeflea marina]
MPATEEASPKSDGIVIAGTESGRTIVVKHLRFSGKLALLPEAGRARIRAAVEGKRLGIAGIRAISDAVTMAIQQQGRMLGYAVLPPQDITEGVVTVEIAEGVLEASDFERHGTVRARGERLAAILAGRVDPESVTKPDLEAALLRMNDHAGVTARARLMSGAAPHSSRLVIGVEQAPLLSASLWGDNAGSASTGRAEASAMVTITDLSGYGDRTQLTSTVSEGQRFGQLGFSLPIGTTDFTINANYGYLDYANIDDVGKALGLEGYAHYAGLELSYSLVRSRDLNVWLSTALNGKALVDDSLLGRLQDKRLVSGRLGIDGERRDAMFGGGLGNWSLGWTYGDLDLSGEPSALAIDQASLKTQGDFHVLDARVSRLQQLPGAFSLFGSVSGQWASTNLDSSQDLSLGGPGGVRGYPVGEGRGDMGAVGTLELRYDTPLPEAWGELQLAGFLDAGHVWLNRNAGSVASVNACGCNDYSLASAGLSARWARDAMNLSVSWAAGLGDNPGRSALTGENADGGTSSQQFWLQGSIKF